jgi:putative ABC transport system permease protein
MELDEIIAYSLHNLRYKKMRSWLTILGIVIGIAAVVSLVTLGESLNKAVQDQFSEFGYNTIYVMPIAESALSGAFSGVLPPSAGKLYENDVQRLKRIPEVETIGRLIEERGSVSFKDRDITAVIDAIEPGIYEDMTAVEIAEGRFIEEGDRKVVVIGHKIAEESFGSNKKVNVNSYLTINNERFRVVGILSSGGGLAAEGLDIAILIPFKDGQEIFRGSLAKNEVGWIAIKTREGADIDEVEEKIRFEMDSSHKITDPDKRDYGVLSSKTMQETVGSILSLVTLFLGAVASISLIVGGLSIANNMLTSVIQRTHEIGVLKAVGANDETIMRIFLFESAAVGGIGGIAGTALGLFAAYLVSFAGIPFSFQPLVAFFGVAFAMLVGLVSGYLPAKRAASLNPVDALRYE